MEQFRSFVQNSSMKKLNDYCKYFVTTTTTNKSVQSNEQQLIPNIFQQILKLKNLTSNSFQTIDECTNMLLLLTNSTNESESIIDSHLSVKISKYSKSLIVFISLITFVSLVSIIGNLCLAKVLYKKRHRLIQTDRIVLCLALSELCLVIIDTPTEIYRLLAVTFTQEWLCRFHTFFEALFSSCIIFYHLLGALDRFVYIHGHTSTRSIWSNCSRRLSMKIGSILLLILPFILSLPLAIFNCLYANIIQTSLTSKSCNIQYNHGILIGFIIFFYLLPILFAFFLHGKLIYFIRTRHHQYYLQSTAFILPMKRNHLHSEAKLTKQSSLSTKKSSHRRVMLSNTETLHSTSMTLTLAQGAPLNPINSSNSSQSSRSSTGTSSTSLVSPIVLYKINSQANANANRTVLLLVLLLSSYVFCWAPFNIYSWVHAYQLTQSNPAMTPRLSNQTDWKQYSSNLQADLRRIIYVHYSLYLLSMISMCFSFIFYFLLNKQARLELSRMIGCMCPWIIQFENDRSKRIEPPKQVQYRTRFANGNSMRKPSLTHIDQRGRKYPNGAQKRTVINYACQVQCCP